MLTIELFCIFIGFNQILLKGSYFNYSKVQTRKHVVVHQFISSYYKIEALLPFAIERVLSFQMHDKYKIEILARVTR